MGKLEDELERLMADEPNDGPDAQQTGYSGWLSVSDLSYSPSPNRLAMTDLGEISSEKASTEECIESPNPIPNLVPPAPAEEPAALEGRKADAVAPVTSKPSPPEMPLVDGSYASTFRDETQQDEPQQDEPPCVPSPMETETAGSSKNVLLNHGSAPSPPTQKESKPAAQAMEGGISSNNMEGDDEEEDEYELISVPPPMPSKEAIEQRIRRLTKPRADGKVPLPEWFMKKWKDTKNGRQEVLNLFEKCCFDPDGVLVVVVVVVLGSSRNVGKS